MIVPMISAPWEAVLTPSQYLLTFYFLAIAALALFAGFIRTWVTQGEVGSRYRGAVVARLGITGIAFVSYVFIILAFATGYTHTDAGYVPTSDAILVPLSRYVEWSLTVPLLAAELLAVCMLAGSLARNALAAAATGAFLMIFAGFLGAMVIGEGHDLTQLVLWGAISCVFWAVTNVVLIRAVRASLPGLTPEAATLLRQASRLLLAGWVVYPLVYIVQLVWADGAATTFAYVLLSVADVVIKIGFGTLIHRVAKLRTAEDVRAGDDVHAESIWISSVKQSDAGSAPKVHLAAESLIHRPRAQPATSSAVAVDEVDKADIGPL